MPVEHAVNQFHEPVMIHAQQIGLVADVNHDGSFPTSLSRLPFPFTRHRVFAADIFFRG